MSRVASPDDMRFYSPFETAFESIQYKIERKEFKGRTWPFEQVVRLYFDAFSEALNRKRGFHFNGERLVSADSDLQETVDAFESVYSLGPHIMDFWLETRGHQIANSDHLHRGSQVFDSVVNDLIDGNAEQLFDCGDAFPGIEIGPGLLTLIGAPPGRGKTAAAMQIVYEAVQRQKNDGLQAVVASLEVTPSTLIKRRLATLIGVSYDAIRFNQLTEYQRRCAKEQDEFRDVLNNVGFLKEDKSGLGDLMTMLDELPRPGLLLMDYVQLFGSADANAQDRGAQTMESARRFCEAGWAVIAISAVNRSSYAKSDIGSFRDTSSIEYSGTACYMLDEASEYENDEDKPAIRQMKLRCLKNRNGQLRSIDLMFNGPQMLFSPLEPVSEHEGDFDDWNRGTDQSDGTDTAQPWKAR